MERWNELIAGHVLGNLTDEEQRELSSILSENPQLRLEISRLRNTATMSRAHKVDWPSDALPDALEGGSEGWADTAHYFLPIAPDRRPPVSLPPVEVTGDEAKHLDSQDFELQKLGRSKLGCRQRRGFSLMKGGSAQVEGLLQRTGLLSWLMALVLVGVGLDNWRVRRLLAIAQERILQLELSADYIPK